jgi:hypothetical protein
MANDLDKFTLQYQVDLKDSIKKLEELHKKMSEVNKTHSESAGKLKELVSGVSDKLGELIPGMGAVGNAAKMMGASFSVVAVAIAAVAVGVKAVIDLKEKYNRQRTLGSEIGVSGMRIEEYERKMVKASNGRLNREQIDEGLKRFSEKADAAYRNPASGEAKQMKLFLGVDVGQYGAKPTGTNSRLRDMGKELAGKTEEQVRAMAIATGQSQEFLMAIQKLGTGIADVSAQTVEEIEARKKAEKQIAELDKGLSEFKESMNQLETQLGILLAGPMAKFVAWIAYIVELINKLPDSEKIELAFAMINPAAMAGFLGKKGAQYIKGKLVPNEDTDAENANEMQRLMNKQRDAGQAKKEVEAADEVADEAKRNADLMSLAISQFSGAVQSFSSAVSTQQAWAAWAGEVGKADRQRRDGGGDKGEANAVSAAAGKISGGGKSGGSGFLASVATIESDNRNIQQQIKDVNTEKGTPAGGYFQIIDPTWKRYAAKAGVDTNMYPNAMSAPRSVQEQVASQIPANQFGPRTQRMLTEKFGKFDKNLTLGALDKQFPGSGGAPVANAPDSMLGGGGESRDKINRDLVRQNIASFLQVDPRMVENGGVNRGDAAFALYQKDAGMQNSLYKMRNEAAVNKGLPAQDKARLDTQIRDMERDLQTLRKFGPGVVAEQKEGGRDLTVGAGAIIINVNGATDAQAVSQAVNDKLAESMNQLLSFYASGIKG